MLKDRDSSAEDPPPKCIICDTIIEFDDDEMKKPCLCTLKPLDRAVGSGRPKPHRSASNPPAVSSRNIAQRPFVAAEEARPANIFRMAMNVYDDASVAYQAAMAENVFNSYMAKKKERQMPINICEDAKVPTAPPSEQPRYQQPNPYEAAPEVKLEQMQPNPHGAAQEVKAQQTQHNPRGAAPKMKVQAMPPKPYGANQTANVQQFQPNPYAAPQIPNAQRMRPQVLIDPRIAAIQQMQLNAHIAAQMANLHHMQPNPYLAAHVPNLQQIQPNPSLAAQVPNIQQTQPNPSLAAQVNAYAAAQAANMHHLARPHIYDELGRTYGISPPGIDQRANHSPINRQMRMNPQQNYAFRMPNAHAYLTAAGNAQLPIDQPIIIQNLLPLLNLENQPAQGGFLAPLDYSMGAQTPNQGGLPLHLIEAALSPTYIAKPAKRYTNPKKKYGNNNRGGYRGRGQAHHNYANRNPQYHARGGGPYVQHQNSYAPVAPNYGNNMPVNNNAQANNARAKIGPKGITTIVNYAFIEYDNDVLKYVHFQALSKAYGNGFSSYAKLVSAMNWLVTPAAGAENARVRDAGVANNDADSDDNDGLASDNQLVTMPQKIQGTLGKMNSADKTKMRKGSGDYIKITAYYADMYSALYNDHDRDVIAEPRVISRIRIIRKPSDLLMDRGQIDSFITVIVELQAKSSRVNNGLPICKRIVIEIPCTEIMPPAGSYRKNMTETAEYLNKQYEAEKKEIDFYLRCIENAVERVRALILKEEYAPRSWLLHPFGRDNEDSPRHDDVF